MQSALLPGSGQASDGRQKQSLIISGLFALGLGSYLFLSKFAKKEKAYAACAEIYTFGVWLANIVDAYQGEKKKETDLTNVLVK